jgi:hypothetical protein
MIKAKVSTIWKGRVGIRDKYVKQALERKEDLMIYNNIESMVIPFEKIEESIKGQSRKPFPDYYSNEKHFLLYFLWRPQRKQSKLL